MFDVVVSAGCSYAYGEELTNENARYSKVVADSYNARLLDFSQSGVSNEYISQTTINGLLHDNVDPEKTLVIVQWTFSNRLNFSGKNARYYTLANHNMNPAFRKMKIGMGHDIVMFNDDFDDIYDLKFYYDTHNNLPFLAYNLCKIVHHTQTFLKTKNYKYVFLFANNSEMEMINMTKRDFDILKIAPFVKNSLPYFYSMAVDIDKTRVFNKPFSNFTNSNRYKVGKFNHPLEDAHVAYASCLKNYIEEIYNV